MFPGDGQVARPRGMISVFDSGGRQVFDRPVDRRATDQSGGRVSDDQHAARRHRAWHRRAGARPRRAWTGRGKDRHHRRLSRRLVCRVFDVGRGRRMGRVRSARVDWARGVWRSRRAADLGRLHEADGAAAAGSATFRCRPAFMAKNCAASPISHRSKGVRSTPSISRTATPCPPHSARFIGERLKQRASRAIEGFFRGLGSKIAGIFHRK